jgi:hypothetical protein
MATPKKELTYSQLVVVRVSHQSPDITGRAAAVLREQLQDILPLWTAEIAEELKPKLEVLPALATADFPFKVLFEEPHQC